MPPGWFDVGRSAAVWRTICGWPTASRHSSGATCREVGRRRCLPRLLRLAHSGKTGGPLASVPGTDGRARCVSAGDRRASYVWTYPTTSRASRNNSVNLGKVSGTRVGALAHIASSASGEAVCAGPALNSADQAGDPDVFDYDDGYASGAPSPQNSARRQHLGDGPDDFRRRPSAAAAGLYPMLVVGPLCSLLRAVGRRLRYIRVERQVLR